MKSTYGHRMYAIKLDRVTKHYTNHRATDAVTLAIEAGQFAVVLGPSGCGKTTLLRLVAGLETPESGRIELHGRDVTHLGPGQREIGMVFQSYALFPHLTVAENLVFGLRLRHVPRAERHSRLRETSQLLGLEALLDRKPAQLSGGQRQRVALGRAIIGGRRTVLMDEPLSNLDAKLRQEMRRELKNLARDLNMTVLYVTHDQAEALAMGDVVVVMNQGCIEQVASPDVLYERPSSVFVAEFIGSPPMNLLPVGDGPHGPVIAGTSQRLETSYGGAAVVLGLRPERIEITAERGGFEATVEAVEYLGADAVVSCRIGPHVLSARVAANRGPLPGERVHVRWSPEAVNLFDAVTGRRLPEPTFASPTFASPKSIPNPTETVMDRRNFLRISTASAVAATLPFQRARAASVIDLPMYYPVAVGGPIAKIMDGYAAAFHRANPDIRIHPIYTGSYQDTTVKALTALRGGGQSAPKLAVALAVDIFTFYDQDVLVAAEDLAKEESTWLNAFYPAFLANSRLKGKTWSVPFQRSTPVLFWNKTAFKSAGLDPERAPADWSEMRAYARRLTRLHNPKSSTEWGLQIPSSGFPYWLFQGLAIENGQTRLASPEGTETYFDSPETIGALEYMVDLARKARVMPAGIINWGTTPEDFFKSRCAMMWTTTGNLTNVRKNAAFPFGVGMLPKHKRRGAPTGGGNLYVFNNTTPAERAAALRFIRWVTSPRQTADWGMQTGYVATGPAAWDTPELKKYLSGFPQAAVARDQLKYAEPELSTHENQRVTQVFNDALQAALTGQKPPAAALKIAQAGADAILRRFRA